MQQLDILEKSDTRPATLSLSLASTREELLEVQRLRYKIFVEGGGLTALQNEERLDQDEFDAYCDHLLVRDSRTLQVVGTYRMLKPSAACDIGKLYCESEFDLSRIAHLRGTMVEAGRACIHPAYRSGAVIMLLWSGIADYMRRHRCEYLIGCASISLADGGFAASSVYQQIVARGNLAPIEYRATPRLAFPLERSNNTSAVMPPLLKGYLKSGAWICGEPAWDPQFHCADLLVLLPLANLDGRYARRYLTEKAA